MLRIPLVGRSVAAAYVRWWAPVVALALFAAGTGVAVMASGAVVVAAWLASWTWRDRPARARSEADLDCAALGSCCPPALRSAGGRDELARALAERAAGLASPRPPEDVARDGAADPAEALLAYGRLRLAGVDDPDAARLARAMLAGVAGKAATDGPYRSSPALAEQLRGVIAELERERACAAVADWARNGRRLVGVAAVATFAAGVFAMTARGSWIAHDVIPDGASPDDVGRALFGDGSRMVALPCDDVADVGFVDRGQTRAIAACRIVGGTVFVTHPAAEPLAGEVRGWLDVNRPMRGLDAVAAGLDTTRFPGQLDLAFVDTTADPLHGFRVLAIAAAIVAAGAGVVAQRRKREVVRLAATL